MNRFIISKSLALALLTGTLSFAQSSMSTESNTAIPASFASDTVDVQHVIDAYHQAVLTHDGARLAQLFIPQGSLWLNVLSDDTYARAKAKSPDAVKVHVGSYTDFVKLVSTSKASFNPTHTNLQINSDGTIASVYFDFVFLIDGKAQNRGSETWVLVKGSDGWRIAAITFSSNPPHMM
jgi:sulfur transfer complex TusBCD TusB component (DsrH family)